MADVMNPYEAMFLLGPGGTTEPEAGQNLVRQMIERHGGQIMVLKKWDERKLAYEIKGQKRGTYLIAYFNAPGNAITAIERDVKLNDEVLRVLITDAGHLNQEEMAAVEPQPIQPREERTNTWERFPSFEGRRDDRGDRAPRDARRGQAAETAGKE